MKSVKPPSRLKKPSLRVRDPSPLKVLVICRSEDLEAVPDILDSVSPLGFSLKLVGVVLLGGRKPKRRAASDVPVLHDYTEIIREAPPDLVVLTLPDRELHARLLELLPASSRILDSFALSALKDLKQVSGQLGTTQHKLHNVEQVKEVLMAGSEVSILVVDEDFKVLDINNAILSRTRMSKRGCLGRPCHWVIHRYMEPCDLRGKNCPVSEVLKTGRSTHRMREEKRDNGASRYFTVSGYPVGASESGKKCVLIVWKDVTKGMGPVLDRQARSIRQDFSHVLHRDKMVALGKLAAATVHDINNPMQGILTLSKLMKTSLAPETISSEQIAKFHRYLDLIASESARCGAIMRNLLSFARQGTLRKTPVHLNSLLDEILLLVENRMELQGITVQKEIAEDVLPLHGDANQLKQALLNLVLNAIEAMPVGGAISIAARLQPNSDMVRIRITDTGPGVPKSVEETLFEPFVTTKDVGKGSGLGLSVVYGIVEQHGGSIELQKEHDKGATFVITLPALRKQAEQTNPELS